MRRAFAIAFSAIWLVLTGWWVFVPPDCGTGNALHLPFVYLSLIQTESTVVVFPTPPDAIRLELLRESADRREQQMREAERQLAQPVPPDLRKRSWWDRLTGPPSGRRRWVDALWDHSSALYWDWQEIQEVQPDYAAAIRSISAEAELLCSSGPGWQRVAGSLAYSDLISPVLVGSYYVRQHVLIGIMSLGLLPGLLALVTLFRKGNQARDPARQEQPPTIPDFRNHRRLCKPNWKWRLGVALIAALVGFFGARIGVNARGLDLIVRKSDELKLRIEYGCIFFGNILDDGWSYDFMQGGTMPPPLMMRRLHQKVSRFRGVFVSSQENRDVAATHATMRGYAYVNDGVQNFLVVPGWILGLPAAFLLIPVLFGIVTEIRMSARRRRDICPACAYPLFGLPEPRCPECGFDAVRKRGHAKLR